MKKTNKGFSLVELIIVIAIMAILAGALAPALIKYINKSRLATDVSNGQRVASAIQTAMTNESAYQALSDGLTDGKYAGTLEGLGDNAYGQFSTDLDAIVSSKTKVKSTKDMKNGAIKDDDYYVVIDLGGNILEVYAGGEDNDDHMVYPTVADAMKEATTTTNNDAE